MSDELPLISVYMPTHNRGDILKRAVTSVLTQSYKNLELIVVNDGSKDDTLALLTEIQHQDSRVIILNNQEAKGACVSRNMAIHHAKGKWITGIDDDDEWLPERLEKLKAYYLEDSSCVYAQDLYERGKVQSRSRKKAIATLDGMLDHNIIGNQVFTETYKLKSIGGFDEKLKAAQDYDAWFRLIESYGPGYCLNEVLQKVDATNARARITSSSNKFKGYLLCYKKQKKLMTPSIQAIRLFKLYKIREKPMSLSVVFVLFIHSKSFNILGYYFEKKIPILRKIMDQIILIKRYLIN